MTETIQAAQNDTGAAAAEHSAPVDGGGMPEVAGGGGNMENRQYVGFWARVGASVIDAIVIQVPVAVAMIFIIYGGADAIPDKLEVRDIPAFIIIYAVFVAFWRWKGATPGKMVIGAKIVDGKTGNLPSINQCMLRYVFFFAAGIMPVLNASNHSLFGMVLISCLWVAFDKKKQGLHDKLAGTVVIKITKNKKQ